MKMVTVIGRGHGGTRAMSHTLSASGVFMGEPLNVSGDLLPPEAMYEACRVMSKHVKYLGNMKWDFDALHTMPIDPAFTRLIEQYLQSVLSSSAPLRGWKIPETTLVFPWIVRMFPEIHYIHWVRDPRDSILAAHLTDDLSVFGVEYDRTDNVRLRRAISWKYQVELIKATPKPRNWHTVRFEDFVLDQDRTLRQLEDYLGIPLAKIEARPDSIARWREDAGEHDFDFFRDDLVAFHYPLDKRKARPARIRKAFVMSVNPGMEEEYEKRHRPIWPELQAMLKKHGAHMYSIYLHRETRQLFGYVEIEDEARWAQVPQQEICRKWWTYMKDIMPSHPDHSPIAVELHEVFHID